MSFLLDTNIISEHLKRPSGTFHRFLRHSGRLAVPTIVLGELYAWAYGRPGPVGIDVPKEVQNWDGSLSYEKVCKYLPYFKSAIQVPIYVLGVDC